MNRTLFLLISLMPSMFYGQITFIVSDSKNVSSKVINILKEQKIFPSDIRHTDIYITDLIDENNQVHKNLNSGLYSIYYHYHWNSFLLSKDKNIFVLYQNPLQNTKSIFEQVIAMDKTKRESKKYLEQIYDYLSYTIAKKYHPRHSIIAFSNPSELKELKKDKRLKEEYEQRELRKEYKYYLNLIRNS